MKKHEIEDCGSFGVWWYHTVGWYVRRADERAWAYALRDGDTWKISECVSGFKTRDEAVQAGTLRTKK